MLKSPADKRFQAIKIRIFFFALFLAALCSPVLAGELAKLNLDDAAMLGTTVQTDSSVKAEGKGSIKITTLHPTTICLGEVTGMDIENATLIFKAKVKSDLTGAAYLEMWAHVGAGQYFSKGVNDPVEGISDWKSIQTPFIFQKGQRPEKIMLNLVIAGRGTVWIDDAVLLKTSLNTTQSAP